MIIEKNDILKAALRYAEQGLAVFPVHSSAEGRCTCGKAECENPGKHPATLDGFKSATREPAKIKKAFSRPGLGIGVATGAASGGWWVLDLDGEEGIAAFERWAREAGAELPEIPITRTGGGGRHLWFTGGEEIRNSTRIGGEPIDVRGTGGYIVAAPSSHVCGRSYKWERPLEHGLAAPAPGWLLDRIAGKGRAKKREGGDSSFVRTSPVLFSVPDNLSSHPGEREGGRHSTAARLIGAALASGTPRERVEVDAIGFARRCSPPMAEAEALRLVGDLAGRQATQVERLAEEVEAVDLPPSKWPRLAEEAFHGIIGEIIQVIEPHSEADPAALLVQALAFLGSAVGRGPHFLVEGTAHHANLFSVIVGATASGRKGTGGGRIREVFGLVDLGWVAERLQSGLVSGEGLIHSVRDPVVGLDRKGQPVVTDPGVADKRLMIVEPEFGGVLRVTRREENTLSPVLRMAWDGGTLRTLAKNSRTIATEPHISAVGHITSEELRRTLADVEVFNGLGNRFLWCLSRRSKLLPSGGGDLDLSRPTASLKEAFDKATKVGRMTRSGPAEERWREIYHDLASRTSSGLFAAITSRAEAQVLRLSMIFALADGSPIIEPEHLEAALAIWEYCSASAAMIFGGSTGASLDDRILEAITSSPGISRRDLHRRLANHCPAGELVAALARLRDGGRAHDRRESTGGRPAECWWPGLVRTNELSPPGEASENREGGESEGSEQSTREGREAGDSSLVRTPTEVFRI
jgi:hypothetical protein